MKKKEKIIKKLNELQDSDIEKIDYILSELKSLKYKKEVTEKSIKTLTTIILALSHMRNEHVDYLVSWLKQNYLLEN